MKQTKVNGEAKRVFRFHALTLSVPTEATDSEEQHVWSGKTAQAPVRSVSEKPSASENN